MLTRARRSHVSDLITAYKQEQQQLKERSVSSSDTERDDAALTARLTRRAERAAIKERRLLCCRRTLRYGEHIRIVELRFKHVGCVDPNGFSYGKIARKLYIRPRTI